jgi:hypothetical protein
MHFLRYKPTPKVNRVYYFFSFFISFCFGRRYPTLLASYSFQISHPLNVLIYTERTFSSAYDKINFRLRQQAGKILFL